MEEAEKLLEELSDEPYYSYCGMVSPKEKLRAYIVKLEREREALLNELLDMITDGDKSVCVREYARKKVLEKLKRKLESDDK